MKSNPSSDLNRRDFIHRTALGAAGLAAILPSAYGAQAPTSQPAAAPANPARKIPFGLQLYTLREECKTDLPGMLSAVGKIGFKGVEFAGYQGYSAKDLRKLLDDSGLVACGTHTPYESVLGDKLQETIEFNKVIGNKFLIVPWMTGKTKQEWLDKATLFNELAEKVKPAGMWIGYHAHAHDFEKFDGESAWDLFFGNTRPEVIMQLDTSNCLEGGANPLEVLKKYPGRARTIHVKANGGGPEAVVGEDKVPWKEVFAFCEGPGKTDWYVLEHETSKEPLATVKRSYAALKAMGKV
jgi:sugar phosphate isomerase/epimerase